MELFIITFSLLLLGFLGISIKIWAKKGGKFAGTCASQNPFLKNSDEPCSICGKTVDESECANN